MDDFAKEGRSAALQEVLDLLTEMEMEPHRPKPEAKPPELEAVEAVGDEGAPLSGEGGGELSPEDLELLKGKLQELLG